MSMSADNHFYPHGKRSVLRSALCVLVALALVVPAAGCNKIKPRKKTEFAFDGVHFKTRVEKVDKDDRSHVRVQVRKATQSIDGAKEAGRYAATVYCVEQYGSSKIEWKRGGPDDENDTLTLVEGNLVMEGTCQI